MNEEPNNVVYLDRHILVSIVSLKLRRATLLVKFTNLRNQLFSMKRDLVALDAELAYYQKQYDKHIKKE